MPTPYSPPAPVDDDAAAHKHLAEASAVDISADSDGSLAIRWAQAPGQQARAISADDAAHLDQLVEAVTAAESKRPRQGGAIAAAHATLGRALFELLDGPERALTRRLQACAERDQPPALTIRLRAEASAAQATEPSAAPIDASASLAAHPAAGWRWALLADSRGPLAARQPGLSLAVQLGDICSACSITSSSAPEPASSGPSIATASCAPSTRSTPNTVMSPIGPTTPPPGARCSSSTTPSAWPAPSTRSVTRSTKRS